MEVVGPILAALLGAVLGGVFREWWVERSYRPKLYIVGQSPIYGPEGTHFRIEVKNKGKRAAENCVAILSNLNANKDAVLDLYTIEQDIENLPRATISSDSFVRIKDMSLCWSRLGNPEAITINRDSTAYFEFGWTTKGQYIRIPSEAGWHDYRIALKIRAYRGELLVTAANTDPAWASFKLIPGKEDLELVITERKPSLEEEN